MKEHLKLKATNKALFCNVKAVLWDWNGTLLDDIDISIQAMNRMLEKRNYPLLEAARYREIFTFPVRDYYLKAGVNFDDHDWDEVAMEFIGNYRMNVLIAKINPEVPEILDYLSGKNIRQFILSAMEQEFLTGTIATRLNIGIFEEIVGLNNHYAHTKVENAQMLVKKLGLRPDEIVMIGDTLHDHEVAEAAGIRCILYSGGHQSKERLLVSGAMVIDSLSELKKLL